MAKSKRRRRRYLPKLTRAQLSGLESAISTAAKDWDCDGWAVVGVPPRLRVAVLVAHRVAVPRAPTFVLELPSALGGGEIEASELATNRTLDVEQAFLHAGAGVNFLAPGAPLLADDVRVGLGAVFAIDGVVHLVTCGHPFGADSATLTALDGTEIATLRLNLFDGADGSDAAIFEVLDDGVAMLQAGAGEESWATGIHEPEPTDNGLDALFFPTRSDTAKPFLSPVRAFSSRPPESTRAGAIMLDRCTAPGDSGSSLLFGGEYYGIASRRSGNFSFFTPVAAVKRAAEQQLGTVTLWSPQ